MHPNLVGKPVVDFLLVIREYFRYLVRRRYGRRSVVKSESQDHHPNLVGLEI